MVGHDLFELDLKKGKLVGFIGRLLSSNVYLLVVGDEAVAVDSGMLWTADHVLEYLNKNHLNLRYVLLTHSHFDHVQGLSKLSKYTMAKTVAHAKSKRADISVNHGEVFEALNGQLSFHVIYTGIHKVDHVWYLERNNQMLFVGDYLPTPEDLTAVDRKLHVKPNIVLPGHGKPETVMSNADAA
jgi:glyoxylase-like metal-dependent hydrolase (beta-lactamase superfamily II)